MRRLVAGLGLVPIILVALAAPAFAHATLESTSPAASQELDRAPREIVLTFDEVVTTTAGSVRLFDATGARVEVGRIRRGGHAVHASVPKLDDGVYVVTWRVTSADSHPVHGAFTFQVGHGAAGARSDTQALTRRLLADQGGDQTVGFVYAVQRTLVFASVLVLVGASAFVAVLWPEGRDDRRLGRVIGGAWLVAVLTTVVGIGVQGAYAAGFGLSSAVKSSVIGDELGTRFGHASLVRLALLAVALVVLVLARRRPTVATRVIGAVVAVGVLATFGWAGHAATGDLVPLALTSDVVHLGAIALWIGGLTALVAGALPHADADVRARIVPRFSQLALMAVVAIVVTGTFQGWRQTRSLAALDDTTYGHLLLVKVGVFLALVALAWTARRWVHARAAESGTRGRRRDASLTVFARTLTGELALAAVVLVVGALLVNAQPGRTALAQPFSTELTAGPLLVDVTVDPAKAGPADIHLYVLDRQGQTRDVDELDVALRLPDRDVGPLKVPVRHLAVGHFVAYGVDLPFPGAWRLDVTARVSDVDQYTASTPVTIR